MDIIILLSRPRSRSLLFELANHEFPIFLKEQNYLKIGSEMYPGTGEVVMEKDAMISILVQSPNGDYYYSLQPRFCILAHELTHIYHEMLYGQEAIEDFKKYGRCKKEYTNPVEQYTITGEKNEKFPEELINENNILQEYNFPPRRNHGGRFMDPVTSADKYFSIAKEADIFFLAAIYDGALKNLEYYFNNQGKLKVENFSLHRFKSNIYNENKVKTLVFLLSKGLDPHFADEDGYSLLHFAVESGDVDFCRKLVNLGVDYNSLAKKNQNSPLHFAIVHNQIDCTKFLLSLEKINVNACNAQQQTPLHLALKMKNAEACNLLLKAKARTDIRDEEEKTAPELAYILNDNECLKYFKSYSCTIL